MDDDGPGVAADRLGHIFDRYYTHRPADTSGSGHASEGQHFGIGLWLVKQHVISAGGQISAINREPHGLRVTIVLPIART